MSITEEWISELTPILFLLLLFSVCDSVYMYICVCSVYVCVYVRACAHAPCATACVTRSENNPQELALPLHSFHHVGPRDQPEAIRLDSSHLSLPNHLACP